MKVKFLIKNIVAGKISDFFENSAMDDRFLKFETISNEIDMIREKLFGVKEKSILFFKRNKK